MFLKSRHAVSHANSLVNKLSIYGDWVLLNTHLLKCRNSVAYLNNSMRMQM